MSIVSAAFVPFGSASRLEYFGAMGVLAAMGLGRGLYFGTINRDIEQVVPETLHNLTDGDKIFLGVLAYIVICATMNRLRDMGFTPWFVIPIFVVLLVPMIVPTENPAIYIADSIFFVLLLIWPTAAKKKEKSE